MTANSENVTGIVPFLHIEDMQRSLAYYVDGLGFTMTYSWIPDGNIRWCRLARGAAAIMLQDSWRHGQKTGRPGGALGLGISLNFNCEDALAMYREIVQRGIEASEPFVGNALWSFSAKDPDGFRLEFFSATDLPEETKLSDLPA